MNMSLNRYLCIFVLLLLLVQRARMAGGSYYAAARAGKEARRRAKVAARAQNIASILGNSSISLLQTEEADAEVAARFGGGVRWDRRARGELCVFLQQVREEVDLELELEREKEGRDCAAGAKTGGAGGAAKARSETGGAGGAAASKAARGLEQVRAYYLRHVYTPRNFPRTFREHVEMRAPTLAELERFQAAFCRAGADHPDGGGARPGFSLAHYALAILCFLFTCCVFAVSSAR